MPRYHFHLKNGSFVRDRNGTELLDAASARTHATKLADELMTRMDGSDQDWSLVKIVVTDNDGAEVFAMRVSSARTPALSS